MSDNQALRLAGQAGQQAIQAHGDWPKWQAALAALPKTETGWCIDQGRLVAGQPASDPDALRATLMTLLPWRKGPLRLGGVDIQTEWRSDWKWDRLVDHVCFQDRRVLDVGAGNGYFGWRMLDAGAREVVACDPSVVFAMQHAAITHFAGQSANTLLALPFEAVPKALDPFDVVMSMGVLYHRRDPHTHLQQLRDRLAPHGVLILETLILPGEGDDILHPQRYAGMRNVHAVPTWPALQTWLADSGFAEWQCLDQSVTRCEEQQRTAWMPFHSLREALDADDLSRTIEGHPAPRRIVVKVSA